MLEAWQRSDFDTVEFDTMVARPGGKGFNGLLQPPFIPPPLNNALGIHRRRRVWYDRGRKGEDNLG